MPPAQRIERELASLSLNGASEGFGQLERFCEVATDVFLVQQAVETSRHENSYWDAAIVAAGARFGMPTLFTEDLSHGRRYGRVHVINPFLSR